MFKLIIIDEMIINNKEIRLVISFIILKYKSKKERIKMIKLIITLMIINVINSQKIALNNSRSWLYPRINENPECKYILFLF
jgi:hypothetical protein